MLYPPILLSWLARCAPQPAGHCTVTEVRAVYVFVVSPRPPCSGKMCPRVMDITFIATIRIKLSPMVDRIPGFGERAGKGCRMQRGEAV